MTSQLTHLANESRLDDMRRAARRMRSPSSPSTSTGTEAKMQRADLITIRRAGAADGAALERLAGLDSAAVPSGDVLIAEVGDEPRAAIDIATGATVADPFRPTADVVVLLRMRASHLRGEIDVQRPAATRRLLVRASR